jgi:hypothetical protein
MGMQLTGASTVRTCAIHQLETGIPIEGCTVWIVFGLRIWTEINGRLLVKMAIYIYIYIKRKVNHLSSYRVLILILLMQLMPRCMWLQSVFGSYLHILWHRLGALWCYSYSRVLHNDLGVLDNVSLVRLSSQSLITWLRSLILFKSSHAVAIRQDKLVFCTRLSCLPSFIVVACWGELNCSPSWASAIHDIRYYVINQNLLSAFSLHFFHRPFSIAARLHSTRIFIV